MTMLATLQGDVSMPDAMQTLNLDDVVTQIGKQGTHEMSANVFIRYLIEKFDYTFEYARDMLYKLIDVGRIVLTERYTLRLAE